MHFYPSWIMNTCILWMIGCNKLTMVLFFFIANYSGKYLLSEETIDWRTQTISANAIEYKLWCERYQRCKVWQLDLSSKCKCYPATEESETCYTMQITCISIITKRLTYGLSILISLYPSIELIKYESLQIFASISLYLITQYTGLWSYSTNVKI